MKMADDAACEWYVDTIVGTVLSHGPLPEKLMAATRHSMWHWVQVKMLRIEEFREHFEWVSKTLGE